jgi:hypothetical protein
MALEENVQDSVCKGKRTPYGFFFLFLSRIGRNAQPGRHPPIRETGVFLIAENLHTIPFY